jgi:hypothetical protein
MPRGIEDKVAMLEMLDVMNGSKPIGQHPKFPKLLA